MALRNATRDMFLCSISCFHPKYEVPPLPPPKKKKISNQQTYYRRLPVYIVHVHVHVRLYYRSPGRDLPGAPQSQGEKPRTSYLGISRRRSPLHWTPDWQTPARAKGRPRAQSSSGCLSPRGPSSTSMLRRFRESQDSRASEILGSLQSRPCHAYDRSTSAELTTPIYGLASSGVVKYFYDSVDP